MTIDPHMNAIETVAWHRVIRIARALRTDGRSVPFGFERTYVTQWLTEMVTLYDSGWSAEVNAFVSEMEQRQMGKPNDKGSGGKHVQA